MITDLEQRLLGTYVTKHPLQAARAMESLSTAELAGTITRCDAARAAALHRAAERLLFRNARRGAEREGGGRGGGDGARGPVQRSSPPTAPAASGARPPA